MTDSVAPSVLSSWTKTIVDALVASGADAAVVLEAAGFDAEALRDPNARLPLTATGRLWKAAAEHMGDPAFGLRASRYVRPTTFHALGYAVFASSSLRDALHRLVRYSRLVSDAMDLELETTATTARLCFVLVSKDMPPAPEALDAVMSLIVRTCRTLTDRSFSLLKVEQRRPEPLDTTPYARFFRCPVEFGAALDALTCDAVVLDQPLPAANPELAEHNDGLIRKYLAEMGQDTLLNRARAVLAEQIAADASPVALAGALGMSVRTLQRRLQEHGTSVAELLGDVRKELACAYLRDKTYSVTEIAFLLGFEDSSGFARAFRRWMGQSPSAYRTQPG
ncbi:MAG TPA: AraC family transcriptional regulator [Polyangiaceae bacterium]|nr:AraC family transcriptional regulator [Polyangiaceae bacterium]